MRKKQVLSLLGLGIAFFLAKPHLLYANPTFGGGSGTKQDPYRLSTPEHLTQLQVAVDEGNSFSGEYFILTNDIDFTGYDNDNDLDNGNFGPIGYWNSDSDYRTFSGALNGNHHTISNLRILLSNRDDVGLFGRVDQGMISNLNLTDVEIQGANRVGGLAGTIGNSNIKNVSASGRVIGKIDVGGLIGSLYDSTIHSSSASSEVVGAEFVGGLIGEFDSSIMEQSFALGEVRGDEFIGGLVGYAWHTTIRDSFASGDVFGKELVGGVVGRLDYSDAKNVFASGYIEGEETVGGLVGQTYKSTINTSFVARNIIGEGWVGGLVGAVDNSTINNVYAIGNIEGINHVGGLVGNNWGDSVIKNAYHLGSVTGTTNVGRISGWHEENSVIENIYYNQEENVGLPLIGLDESTVSLGDIVGLNLNQMSQTNSKNYMTLLDFENVWVTTSTTPMFRWQTDLMSANRGDIQINGNIQPMMADVTIPSVSPDLVIDPNSPDGVMSPEFSIENQSTSPIKLELKTFEQTTSAFNDVLPNKYSSWDGLNKTQSQDLALGLVAKEGEGWQRLTTPISYVSGHNEHEIGVMKPTSQVKFGFDVHHGRAFSESKTVQYRMVFVFDLLS